MKKTFFLFLFVISPLFSQDLEQFIEEERIKTKVPGVAVCIVKDNQIVFAKGFGIANSETKEKVDENTIFQLASVTKTITAASLAILKEEGKVDWDTPIRAYLPFFFMHDNYATEFTTLRDLLCHRTGLPTMGGDLLGKLGYKDEEVLRRIQFIKPANSFRNQAYYSNVGFFIAGQVVPDYENFVKSKLFRPLEMNRSGFSENLKNSNVASSHAIVDGNLQVIPADPTGGFPAAGSATSTAKDMASFMIMHLNNGKKVLKSKTVEELFTPSMIAPVTFSEIAPINKESSFAYCLGWDSFNYKGHRIIEKAGGLDGIRTIVTLIPEKNMGITVLCNLNLAVLPETIRAKFLEDQLGKSDIDLQREIAKQGVALSHLLDVEKPSKILPNTHPLSQFTGTYESELYGKFTVVEEDKMLVIYAGPKKLKGTLKHYSNNTFLLSWPVLNLGHEKITFTFGETGKAIQFTGESLGVFLLKP